MSIYLGIVEEFAEKIIKQLFIISSQSEQNKSFQDNSEKIIGSLKTILENLKKEQQETRATIQERCEQMADKVNNSNDFAVCWCNLNDEGNLLEKLIPDAVQISGRDSDDRKEEKLILFSKGESRVMIIKPKIGAFGLNWQHCNHVLFFPDSLVQTQASHAFGLTAAGSLPPIVVNGQFLRAPFQADQFHIALIWD